MRVTNDAETVWGTITVYSISTSPDAIRNFSRSRAAAASGAGASPVDGLILMDLTVPPEAEAFRERLRRFLRDNLLPGWAGIGALDESKRLAFGRRWRELVSREGLLAVSWPREYGGAGLGPLEQFILAEEFIAAGVPLRPLPGDQPNFGRRARSPLNPWPRAWSGRLESNPHLQFGRLRLCH